MTSLFSTPAKAEAMLAKLSAYYGERVATATAHCQALYEWMRVMDESGYAPHVGEAWSRIQLDLRKSNLAARLVYGGEEVRTEPCPIHKGHWSGCVWGDATCPEGCMYGSNVTGWLRPRHAYEACPDDAQAASSREHFGFDPTARCQHCFGIESAVIHQAGEEC